MAAPATPLRGGPPWTAAPTATATKATPCGLAPTPSLDWPCSSQMSSLVIYHRVLAAAPPPRSLYLCPPFGTAGPIAWHTRGHTPRGVPVLTRGALPLRVSPRTPSGLYGCGVSDRWRPALRGADSGCLSAPQCLHDLPLTPKTKNKKRRQQQHMRGRRKRQLSRVDWGLGQLARARHVSGAGDYSTGAGAVGRACRD